MTAKGTYIFDAETAAANAKIDAMNTKAGGVPAAFTKGAKALELMASPLGLVASASTVVLGIWQDIAKTQEEAANRMKAAQPARARVLSRARNGKEVGRIAGAMEDTMVQTGASEQEAALLQEKLEGAGLAGYRQKFAGLRDRGVDAASVADSVGNIRDVYKDANPNELLDRLGKAAQASDATLEQFVASVAQAAPAAKLAGVSLNEVVAILSQVGGKEIPQLAAGLDQLSKHAIKTGAKGGFLDLVDKLGALTPRQQQGRLGSKNIEGLNAINQIMAHRGDISLAMEDQNNANGFLADQDAVVTGADAATRLTRNAARAKAQKEQSERRGGMADLTSQERTDRLAAEYGVAGRLFPNIMEGYSRLFGGPVSANATLLNGGDGRAAFDAEEDRRIQEGILKNTIPPPPRFRGEGAANPDSETNK